MKLKIQTKEKVKPYKSYTKDKIAVFSILILFISLFFCFFNSIVDYCVEEGECKEGSEVLIDNNKKIIISKQTCIENKGKWFEDTKMCYLY